MLLSMRSIFFYAIVFGFLTGVLFATYVTVPIFLIGIFICIAFPSTVFLLFFRKESIVLITILLTLGFALLGMLRYQTVGASDSIPEIEATLGSRVTIEGMITEPPERREKSMKVILQPERINNIDIATDALVLVAAENYSDFSYGDRVSVVGSVKRPENFTTDSGAVFDYVSYLAKEHIAYEMRYPKIEIIGHGAGNPVKEKLFMLRESFKQKISRMLPAPEDAFLAGILLGSKEQFGKNLKDDFVTTGTVHMIALSGYNVTIVAETMFRFFSFLPMQIASVFGIGSILLFALLAGGGSTVFRASIMAVLVVVARIAGRRYDIGRALALAAGAMVAINPRILVSDVSFQLSFLATLGIVYLAPKLSHHLRFVTERFQLREILSGTLAAQIATLPFIIWKTGILSLVALPANMLVLPFVPLTMLFGFYAGAVGFISEIIAMPISYIAYGLLHYELSVIRFFADLPFAAVTIPHVPRAAVVVPYVLLCWWIFKTRLTEKGKNASMRIDNPPKHTP